MRAVADRGDERWVHERGAEAHRDRAGNPGAVSVEDGERGDAEGLEPEPANDERFAADVVGRRAGPELGEAPRCGIDGDDDADASDRETLRGEEEGNQAPYQGIVEVVHQSGLAHR